VKFKSGEEVLGKGQQVGGAGERRNFLQWGL